MPLSKKTFASPGIPSTEDLHAMLHSDNVQGWEHAQAKQSMVLEPWVLDNILHVVDACPKVLALWKRGKSDAAAEKMMYRCIAAALEPLDDHAKAGILTGYYEGEAQAGLFHFIKTKPAHWLALSPSWSGPPESDLRAAAVARGWTCAWLPDQVGHSLGRPEAQRWSQWVPYAHALAMVNFKEVLEWRQQQARGGEVKSSQSGGQSWARPEDMALAHAIARYVTGWEYAMSVHPDAQPVPRALQEHMDTLVQMHRSLGMMPALKQAIIAGNVPYQPFSEPPLALPVLDTGALGV